MHKRLLEPMSKSLFGADKKNLAGVIPWFYIINNWHSREHACEYVHKMQSLRDISSMFLCGCMHVYTYYGIYTM